jgi:hypothetical protein
LSNETRLHHTNHCSGNISRYDGVDAARVQVPSTYRAREDSIGGEGGGTKVDSVAGLYDIVNGVSHTSVGTIKFMVRPDVN